MHDHTFSVVLIAYFVGQWGLKSDQKVDWLRNVIEKGIKFFFIQKKNTDSEAHSRWLCVSE